MAKEHKVATVAAVITGATSQVGRYLSPRLAKRGLTVYAISRRDKPSIPELLDKVKIIKTDIGEGLDLKGVHAQNLVHMAPLWLLPDIVDDVARIGVRRIIAFGSTSLFTKVSSTSPHDRDLVGRLKDAEEKLAKVCEKHRINWTIFRPTMIYGHGLDQNVTAIGNFIRRFRFFPLAGKGEGLRSPVHADDLANAVVAALDNAKTFNKSYNLSGGEVLSYRVMVERIFTAEGKKPAIIHIPLPLLRFAIKIALTLPQYKHLSVDMADRMNNDQNFDNSDARSDFGYSPRSFTLE